jgi:hypothetical protein
MHSGSVVQHHKEVFMKRWSAILGMACFLAGTGLYGAPLLDFNMDAMHGPTASISFAGGANPLVGVDISVDSVLGIDTPHTGMHSLVDATLSFTTGNLSGNDANNWFFSNGGSIQIVGGVDLTGDGDANDVGDIAVGTLLLDGQFISASVTKTNSSFRVAIALFLDVKDPDLLGHYGLPTTLPNGDPLPYKGNLNLSFTASGNPPAGFTSSNVLSGDVTNAPTPEPVTILLLGTSSMGLAALSRRRRAKARD